jgi:hypothetical protein
MPCIEDGSPPDANPEAIQVGVPLDGSSSPAVALGVGLSDIVGVVTYAYVRFNISTKMKILTNVLFRFGFYQVLPLTAPEIISRPEEDQAPSTIFPDDSICTIIVGDYNVGLNVFY